MGSELDAAIDYDFWNRIKDMRDRVQREAHERKRAIALRTTVILSSDVFGDEGFKYDTDEDILEGVTRLFAEGKKRAGKDGITREIKIRIEPQMFRSKGAD